MSENTENETAKPVNASSSLWQEVWNEATPGNVLFDANAGGS
jgi:hypothetical protein